MLRGGDGHDWLSGDQSDDNLHGGASADTFHTFGGANLDWVPTSTCRTAIASCCRPVRPTR
ncbi:hypothetical protein [Phenylobacterium sp.]|uniref:hypothetical protein n=1 Tax=Phenylobacterium sp. TaxID=1871053 RepID=UPI003983B30C